MLDVGDRNRQFQLCGHVDGQRWFDLDGRPVYSAHRFFDDDCDDHRNLDSGHLEVGHDDGHREPNVDDHLGYCVVFAFYGPVRPDQPVFGVGYGRRQFQFGSHVDRKRRYDLDIRTLHRAGCSFDDARDDYGDLDTGLIEVGHGDCDGESLGNDHLGDSHLFAFNNTIQSDQPMFGDGDGDGQLQQRGYVERERWHDLVHRPVYRARRVFDDIRDHNRDLSPGFDYVRDSHHHCESGTS